eukprot:GILJ01009004.1.p2 GENE.GILJ01009004.1~~GILJ01009004.1.p2  ORF type:complete len:200 (-),score=33.28 GILJ01009004.1:1182-1724(-)
MEIDNEPSQTQPYDPDTNNGEADPSILSTTTSDKKKRMTSSKPKLDAELLDSDKGLSKLYAMTKELKFKGKGHEASDLNKVMSVYRKWALELFPAMSFEDVLETIETISVQSRTKSKLQALRDEHRMANYYAGRNNDMNEGGVDISNEEAVMGGSEVRPFEHNTLHDSFEITSDMFPENI